MINLDIAKMKMDTIIVEETEHPSKDESAGDAFEMLKSDHRYVKERR